MAQFEEMNEWNQAASLIECGQSTFDKRTEKSFFREGRGIAIVLARLGDEEMGHFSSQKSVKINRFEYIVVVFSDISRIK